VSDPLFQTRFSPCRTWRYTLARPLGTCWASGLPLDGFVNFIGLNPSTADETRDDPTVRRCIDFARRWGHGGVVVTNIFGYRSTDPQALYQVPDPVGPGNNQALFEVACHAVMVVAAWGVHGEFMDHGAFVADMLDRAGIPLFCLGWTKAGYPRHPLYLRKTVSLVRYGVEARPASIFIPGPRRGRSVPVETKTNRRVVP
jgi:hypothetical protein